MGFFTGVLTGIDHHQFYVVADAEEALPDYAEDRAIAPHGLIAVAGHALCVTTGIALGAIHLQLDVLDGPPGDAIDESRPWSAVSEVSFEATSSVAAIHLLMTEANPPFDDLIVLPDGPGWYRVRAHAVGRELDFDAVVHVPREFHLLQLWKADGPQPADSVRVDNRWALQRHA